ncbi:MAG TPA: DinB family protein [Acidimicrobiales bacterium]|nr:DinB family protein [Acidimicrobiales bacterium]
MPADDPRTRRPSCADERTTMAAFLNWHRQTLEIKCAGLTPGQLALQPVGMSRLSLLGLVRHTADAERFWFRRVIGGEPCQPLFASATGSNDAFDVAGADEQMVAEAWELWRAEVRFAQRLIDEAPSLDVLGEEPGEGPVSMRWALAHMLEEYARHNGHADLIRETIDGTVGL